MKKQALSVTVRSALKDYVAAIAAVLQLPAEAIYWTNSKTFGKYESFTHHNKQIYFTLTVKKQQFFKLCQRCLCAVIEMYTEVSMPTSSRKSGKCAT